MKTLFVLTGQLRGFNHSYPTIKKFLEPRFGEVDYLFFYLKESVLVEDLMPQSKIIHSSFIEKNPVSEVQAEWGVPPKGMAVMMQWYMGYQGKLLAEKYSRDYDYFVRLRPDAFFYEDFKLDLPKPNNNTILTPNNLEYKGYCDRIAVGDPKAMGNYFNFYHSLCDNPPRKGKHARHNSEQRLKFYLNSIDVNIDNTQHIPFCLSTEDGLLRYTPGCKVKNLDEYKSKYKSRKPFFYGRDCGKPRVIRPLVRKEDLCI